MSFVDRYGPWALVAGASDGVGAVFAEGLAERGVNVVLLARRGEVLREVAAGIEERTGARTRCLAVDLAEPDAVDIVTEHTAGLDVGMVVYCAGADPEFRPFLSQPIESAEKMVQRNCLVPMRLCHHFAPAMVARGRGGIVLFGSGAGFAGGPNMVAYSATKAFDMVFAEALWAELHDSGVDVLGLILGKTDTPALRRLEHARGQIASPDERPADTATATEVVGEAFDNLANGPTWIVGENTRAAAQMMGSVSRNDAVRFIKQAIETAMGPG
ncbi:SDR family NAD(P)-dependent oxidoreductase [Mycobacterium sp. Y57]|uniref:SDR family NAD(P)-dependent oxidoreductase n=1 Tax=Mycolicibacterium xanthum TaxID=2796469 RepID=UPI001C84B546|nr:SDR family NAD(P)-dependent oxidoreductase [Mycolicibacterium xanthum]MBX7433348.1 SDR family NAD(P)-dependent oxidoreductase [Mycolicibacterium xanthum]